MPLSSSRWTWAASRATGAAPGRGPRPLGGAARARETAAGVGRQAELVARLGDVGVPVGLEGATERLDISGHVLLGYPDEPREDLAELDLVSSLRPMASPDSTHAWSLR